MADGVKAPEAQVTLAPGVGRYDVQSGFTDGVPWVKIVDNLAVQTIELDLLTALDVGAALPQIVAVTLREISRLNAEAARQPSIVVPDARMTRRINNKKPKG